MDKIPEVQPALSRVNNLAKEKGISKKQIAKRIGVSYSTLKKWFSKTKPRLPSRDNLKKLNSFVESFADGDVQLQQVWVQIRNWWKTQHRYASVGPLAEDIGWEATALHDCFEKGIPPPRVVIEKMAEILSIPFGQRTFQADTAQRKIDRIKNLLLILEEELRWFRDGSTEARRLFRTFLDPMDIGYLSSLLVMLGEEEAFRRWLTLTTNRFNYFKAKGRKNESQSSD